MTYSKGMDGYQLMIPGPIQLSPEVLEEMARPMVPHYGTEWTSFYNETVDRLRAIFQTSGDVFLIPGSGSAALEAVISSCLGTDDRVMILSNGWFGERLEAIANSHSANVLVKKSPIFVPLQATDLDEALGAAKNVRLVAVVHSESSSGLLNPVRELAEVCRKHDVLFMVDAISSIGGIELAMDDWGVDLCVGASQKCLEGPPGLGLVAMSERAWAVIDQTKSRGWYLNLHVWKEFAEQWSDWHPYPITMAVPAVRGLRRGVEAIFEEGLQKRFERHRAMAGHIRERLSTLGFAPVFDEASASPTVVAMQGQPECSANEVVERLKREHRILIAKGMGSFAGKAFRIGNMGPQATHEQIDVLVNGITSLVDGLDGTGSER